MNQNFKQATQKRSLLQRLFLWAIGLFLTSQFWSSGTIPAHATGIYSVPSLSAGDPTLVVDQAEVLSRLSRGTIINQLEKLAKATGDEVRLVTIHRLDYGETIESFTNQLFDKWFPTPEAQANQVLLVLDNLTNTAAIRTGEDIKSVLPDETATSIAQETLMAPLRTGDRYNQAFLDASDRLVAILTGQPDPGPPVIAEAIQTEGTFATPEETKGSNATIWVIGLLIAATVIPMATYFLYQGFQG